MDSVLAWIKNNQIKATAHIFIFVLFALLPENVFGEICNVKEKHRAAIGCAHVYYGPKEGYIINKKFAGYAISDTTVQGFRYLGENRPKAAITDWLALANRGDAAAQVNLAMTYYQGRIVPRDYSNALKWIRRSKASKSLWNSSNHTEARIIQKVMSDLGFYNSKIDGDFGPQSARALSDAKIHFNLSGSDTAVVSELAQMADRRGLTMPGLQTYDQSPSESELQTSKDSPRNLKAFTTWVLLGACVAIIYLLTSRPKSKVSKTNQTTNNSNHKNLNVDRRPERPVVDKKVEQYKKSSAPARDTGTKQVRILNERVEILETISSEEMLPPTLFSIKGYGDLLFQCGCGALHAVNSSEVEVIANYRPVKILFKCKSHYTKVEIKGLFIQKCESEWSIENATMATITKDLGL